MPANVWLPSAAGSWGPRAGAAGTAPRTRVAVRSVPAERWAPRPGQSKAARGTFTLVTEARATGGVQPQERGTKPLSRPGGRGRCRGAGRGQQRWDPRPVSAPQLPPAAPGPWGERRARPPAGRGLRRPVLEAAAAAAAFSFHWGRWLLFNVPTHVLVCLVNRSDAGAEAAALSPLSKVNSPAHILSLLLLLLLSRFSIWWGRCHRTKQVAQPSAETSAGSRGVRGRQEARGMPAAWAATAPSEAEGRGGPAGKFPGAGGRPVTQPRAAGADVRGGTAGGQTDSSRLGGILYYSFLIIIIFFLKSPGHVSVLSAPGALRGKAPHWAQLLGGVCVPVSPGVRVRVCVSVCACPCPGRSAPAPRPAARLPGAVLASVAPQRQKSRLFTRLRNIF